MDPVHVLYRLRGAGDVQRDDRPCIDEHLVGAKSEFAHVLVLHYELLSLPNGDL